MRSILLDPAYLRHVVAARFTQIDFDRKMALILVEPGIAGTTDIYGVVRIIGDPDNERGDPRQSRRDAAPTAVGGPGKTEFR